MSKSAAQSPAIDWPLEGPLAMEHYLAALQDEEAYQRTLQEVISRIGQRLPLPVEGQLVSAEEVRALFARCQHAAPSQDQLISELVAEMREER